MKKLIKSLLKKFGYKIYRIDNEREGIVRIKEMEELYRELVFKELPPSDKVRIRLMYCLEGTNIGEAIYLVRYLHKTLRLEGDVCEFGVAAGKTSALVVHEIRNTDKKIWLFDSFAGLPKPSDKDELKDDIFNLGSIERYEGEMGYNVSAVKKELSKINIPQSRIKIIPGFIEKTIHMPDLPKKFALLTWILIFMSQFLQL